MSKKENTITNKISIKIKFERMKRNLSQDELAFNAGISRAGLSKIETGKVSPTMDTLEKIAGALGVEFLDLVDVSKVDL